MYTTVVFRPLQSFSFPAYMRVFRFFFFFIPGENKMISENQFRVSALLGRGAPAFKPVQRRRKAVRGERTVYRFWFLGQHNDQLTVQFNNSIYLLYLCIGHWLVYTRRIYGTKTAVCECVYTAVTFTADYQHSVLRLYSTYGSLWPLVGSRVKFEDNQTEVAKIYFSHSCCTVSESKYQIYITP